MSPKGGETTGLQDQHGPSSTQHQPKLISSSNEIVAPIETHPFSSRDHIHAPLSNHLTTPGTINSPTSPGNVQKKLTLRVYYPLKGLMNEVSFPPGITINQARDICLLRFNLWHQALVLVADASGEPEASVEDTTNLPLSDGHRHKNNGTEGAVQDDASISSESTSATTNTSSSFRQFLKKNSQKSPLLPISPTTPNTNYGVSKSIKTRKSASEVSTNLNIGGGNGGNPMNINSVSLRDKFALFWPEEGVWLEPSRSLSSYCISQYDLIELQQANNVVSQQYGGRRRTQSLESNIYWLQTRTESISSAWKLRWAILRGSHFSLYKKKPTTSPPIKPDLRIDLSQPFKMVDQNGTCSTNESIIFGPLLAMSMMYGGDRSQNSGVLFVIQSGGKMHIFRSMNQNDFELWKTALREAQVTFASRTSLSRISTTHSDLHTPVHSAERKGSIGNSMMFAAAANHNQQLSPMASNECNRSSLSIVTTKSASSQSPLRHSGCMHQRIPGREGFRRCFFELEGSILSVYRDEAMAERRSMSVESLNTSMRLTSINEASTSRVEQQLEARYRLNPQNYWAELCWLGSKYLISLISNLPPSYHAIVDSQNSAIFTGNVTSLSQVDPAAFSAPGNAARVATESGSIFTDAGVKGGNNSSSSSGGGGRSSHVTSHVTSHELMRCLVDNAAQAVEWKLAFINIAGIPVHDYLSTSIRDDSGSDSAAAVAVASAGSCNAPAVAEPECTNSNGDASPGMPETAPESLGTKQPLQDQNPPRREQTYQQLQRPLSLFIMEGAPEHLNTLENDNGKGTTDQDDENGKKRRSIRNSILFSTFQETIATTVRRSGDRSKRDSVDSSQSESSDVQDHKDQISMSEFFNMQRLPGTSPIQPQLSGRPDSAGMPTSKQGDTGGHYRDSGSGSSSVPDSAVHLRHSRQQQQQQQQQQQNLSSKSEVRWVPIDIEKYKLMDQMGMLPTGHTVKPFEYHTENVTSSGNAGKKLFSSLRDAKMPWAKRRESTNK